LFLLYINDIDKGAVNKLLKFADETNIAAVVSDTQIRKYSLTFRVRRCVVIATKPVRRLQIRPTVHKCVHRPLKS